MGIRSEQKDERYKQILEVALQLFVEKGYSATKITDIAKAAHMSMGLLFHYFPNKEGLYQELIKIGIDGMKYPQSMNVTDPEQFFLQFTKQLFSYVKNEPWVARMFVFMEEARRNDTIPENIREIAFSVDQVALSAKMIEAGQRIGEFREGNPQALSYAFWASIQGIMTQLLREPKMPLPKAEWVVAMIKKER